MRRSENHERNPNRLAVLIKWLIRLIFGIFCLILLLVLLLYLPPVQHALTRKIARGLSEKLNTEISLASFRLNLNGNLVLTKIYVEDLDQDTLLYAGRIEADISMIRLLNKTIFLDLIRIEGMRSGIHIDPEQQSSNYNFIIEAFSSNQKTEKDLPDKPGWKFALGKVSLSEISVDLNLVGRLNMALRLGEFEARSKNMDLDKLTFHLGNIRTANSAVTIRFPDDVTEVPENMPDQDTQPDDQAKSSFLISFGELSFDNINLKMLCGTKTAMDVSIGEFTLEEGKFNQDERKISAGSVLLDNSGMNYVMMVPPDTVKSDDKDQEQESKGITDKIDWDIGIGAVNLNRFFLTMHHEYMPDTAEIFDPDHIEIRDLRLAAEDISLDSTHMHALIRQLGFSEGKKFSLKSFSGEFLSSPGMTALKDLGIETDHSRLKLNLSLGCGIDELARVRDSDTEFGLKISDSHLGKYDIDYLLGKKETLKGFDDLSLKLDAGGTVQNISLADADLLINGNSRIRLSGSVRHAADPEQIYGDIKIGEISSSLNQIAGFYPGLDSLQRYLPDEFMLRGMVRGSRKSLKTALDMTSTKGNITIDGNYADRGKSRVDTLAIDFTIDHYDISDFLENDSLKFLTVSGKIGSSGLMKGDIGVDAGLDISIGVADTLIDRFHVYGSYSNQHASAKMYCPDPLFDFDLSAKLDLEDSIMDYEAIARFSSIDLNRLGLIGNRILISSKIQASGKKDANGIKGDLEFDSLELKSEKSYTIRKIESAYLFNPDTTGITLNTDNVSAVFSTSIAPGEIPGRIKEYFKRAVGFPAGTESSSDGRMKLEVEFSEPLYQLSGYVPYLDTVYIDKIRMDFDESEKYFNASMNIPDFQYGNVILDSLLMNIQFDSHDSKYNIEFGSLSFNSIKFSELEISGFFRDSVMHNQLVKLDSSGNSLYFLGVDLKNIPGSGLAIIPFGDSLILNGNFWNVTKNSRLLLDEEEQLSGEISIFREEEKISAGISEDGPFFLETKNFNLDNISEIVAYYDEKLKLDGKVDLNAEVNLPDSLPEINADISISDLILNQVQLGNISAQMNNQRSGQIKLNLLLENEGNSIRLDANYRPAVDLEPLNAKLHIDITTLSAFESFANGKINELKGKISGDVVVKGSFQDFLANGNLSFDQIGFYTEQLNNRYYIEDEILELAGKDLRLKNFSITDSLKNLFTLDGSIGYLRQGDIPLNMHILADHFTFYNTTEKINPSLFGKLILTMDAKATGTIKDPRLDVGLTIEKETDLTFVMPPKEINLVNYEDIVEFESPYPEDLAHAGKEQSQLTDTLMSRFEGISMDADIAIRQGAGFKLVMDPNSGDFVNVSGQGDLNLQFNEGTDPLLSGVYELQNGVYRVSFYGLVQKSFNIQQGSTILWAGDPENARMNITATYVLRTASTSLVAAETAGLSDEEMNQYRKTLPYEVKIMITGTFKNPELDFEINLIDENKAAYPLVMSKLGRLNGTGYESELTQQVFGLLTIGSFIPEQTFDSGGGGYGSALVTTAAANSLNGILTNELNKLSGKYLTGVNIDVGMQSYSQVNSGNPSTQTTMDVRFSKNFFDDRVTIEAQTSFDVGGDIYPNFAGENYSNFQSDFTIKYDLTPQGDYKLKAFNKSSYDIIYKDIRTTGIAIIFVKDFDRLADLRKKQGEKKNNSK